MPMVGVVDTAVMGRLPDPVYIGAVALGAAVYHAAFWLFSFLKQGTTGEVAQAHGARDDCAVTDAALRGLGVALALGLLLALAAAPVTALGFGLMQGSAAVESLAREYFTVRVWGAPATLANLVIIGVLIGAQRAGTALALQLLLNLTNMALSAWFVLGLGWGVGAVASASVIADVVAATAGLVVLVAMRREALVPRRAFAPRRLKAMAGVNGDIMIRSLCLTGAFFYFQILNSSLGDLTLAANVVLLHFMSVMAYGLDGFAHTAEALTGAAYGARDRRALRDAVRYSTAWAFALSVAASLVLALFGETFVGWLTTIPEVRLEAASYLPWLVAAPLLSVWCFQLDGVFIGTLRTAEMRNAMIASVLVYAAAVQVLPGWLGNHGLWAGLMVLNVTRALTLGAYLPRVMAGARPAAPGTRAAS